MTRRRLRNSGLFTAPSAHLVACSPLRPPGAYTIYIAYISCRAAVRPHAANAPVAGCEGDNNLDDEGTATGGGRFRPFLMETPTLVAISGEQCYEYPVGFRKELKGNPP